METTREKAGKEETKMSPVSWSEPRLLVWEQEGFLRGRNVAIGHPWPLYVINRMALDAEERWLPRTDADAPANYPNSCGHNEWLSVKRCGQLSQRLWTILAIALDKR